MATKKITDLTLQSAGNIVTANDVLPIVDIANNETKRITIDTLTSATSASITTSASNAAITFDNLPTSVEDARQIGSGSLFVSGSTVNAGAKALFVFTG
jgi:hypothetical protein